MEAGPGGDQRKDAQGCDFLPTELPHLCGPAASHSFCLKEIGQHLQIAHHM